jgi:predicted amidohydrolase
MSGYPPPETLPPVGVGRLVRILSISFANGRSLSEIAAVVDREAATGVDLVALPETWLGQIGHEPESLDGPTIRAMAALASKHRTYIVCPIDRCEGGLRLNSAVLIDRHGRAVGTYDKVYPYWSEFEVQPPVRPGREAPVFQTDFGRVGMAICFDANFPEVWQRLADQGAELVVWPSAYSAGTTLQAHAVNHAFYVVTSTQMCDCAVYDITGQEIYYSGSPDIDISRVSLDLDRGIYHENFNLEQRDRLLAECGDVVEQEQWLTREQHFVLRSRAPGVSARALAKQYGLEELRDYISRSRNAIDGMRGRPFSTRRP